MKRWILFALLAPQAFALAAGDLPSSKSPEVDARVMAVSVTRHGDTLWRFIRFNTESDYPCLRFQAIQPDQNWRVVDQRDVCEVMLPGGYRLAFNDTAYTGFTDTAFSTQRAAFLFEVEYLQRTGSGERRASCVLPVAGGKLGAVTNAKLCIRTQLNIMLDKFKQIISHCYYKTFYFDDAPALNYLSVRLLCSSLVRVSDTGFLWFFINI